MSCACQACCQLSHVLELLLHLQGQQPGVTFALQAAAALNTNAPSWLQQPSRQAGTLGSKRQVDSSVQQSSPSGRADCTFWSGRASLPMAGRLL